MDLESQAAEESARLEKQIDLLKMEVQGKDNELNKLRHEKVKDPLEKSSKLTKRTFSINLQVIFKASLKSSSPNSTKRVKKRTH